MPEFVRKLPDVPAANLRAKRMLDLWLVAPMLVPGLPTILGLAGAYRLSNRLHPADRGPILRKVFRDVAGKARPIYKFRVAQQSFLRHRAEALSASHVQELLRFLTKEDRTAMERQLEFLVEDLGGPPTRMGHLLKLFYLDELPQLLNILRGDLSFVGPRPFPFSDARARPDDQGRVSLGGQQLDYAFRDKLPGGLTGLYQLNKSEQALEDYLTFRQEGVGLDRQYYEFLCSATPGQVVVKDLSIIVRTLGIVASHKGV